MTKTAMDAGNAPQTNMPCGLLVYACGIGRACWKDLLALRRAAFLTSVT